MGKYPFEAWALTTFENSQNESLDNQEDLVKKLTELKELHEKKILSDEEFATAKKKILGE